MLRLVLLVVLSPEKRSTAEATAAGVVMDMAAMEDTVDTEDTADMADTADMVDMVDTVDMVDMEDMAATIPGTTVVTAAMALTTGNISFNLINCILFFI